MQTAMKAALYQAKKDRLNLEDTQEARSKKG